MMTKKPTDTSILITRDFPSAGINLLKEVGFQLTFWSEKRLMTPSELIAASKKHDALFCSSNDKLTAQFLHECKHLQIISQFSAGYDNIDLTTATKLKIPFGNAPGAMKNATADVAFGLMIAVSRKMFFMHKKIERGDLHDFQPKANLGQELNGKTLGVFGLGHIGTEMAKKCKGAYDMNIIYHNRRPNTEAEKSLNAEWVSFEELLKRSDVLSVHCGLTPETKGLFNQSVFEQMKPSAIFINTARGQVHNEKDLTLALQNKTIWGAGLDVTNPEPMVANNPLLNMENVCILPHIGSATLEARDQMSIFAAQNIIAFYKGETIPHLVNPEVLE